MRFLGFSAVFLPLLGFLLAGVINKRAPDRVSQFITCLFMGLALLASFLLFNRVVLHHETLTWELARWISVGDFHVSWGIHLDALSVVMVTTINIVSFLVHVYSIGYMSHDHHIPRFMAYLSLFTWTMLMLVTAPNLLQVFFGWEGVGLASYLLIGFWYHKSSANSAAMKAFLTNRVGDVGLALGIALVFSFFGVLDFTSLFGKIPHALLESRPQVEFLSWSLDAYNTMALLLFVGSMGKSAQLGLHVWLPDAMEGPTPVSALIHAATMVTAGVFLVVRMSPLFELAPLARDVVIVVGALTAFFAASVAIVQNDIKRIIAYSTCSQLGYMFFAAGCSAYAASMFHLVTHAFFKALLFLGAGSVIHAMSDEQDIRRMGGIYRMIPLTYAMIWIGSLAGAGIPLFSGYYSKDLILETAFSSPVPLAKFAFVMGVMVAVLTAFYSWRLIFMAFHGKPRSDERVMAHVHESPMTMRVPLIVLSIGAVFLGMLGVHGFIGDNGTGFWGESIRMLTNPFEAAHHTPFAIKLLTLFMPLVGIGLAYYMYILAPHIPEKISLWARGVYQFLLNKWYVDELYEKVLIKPWLSLGIFFWQRGDVKTIDRFGPDGISTFSLVVSRVTMRLQTGYVYHYALAMLLGVIVLLSLFMFKGMRG